MSLGQLGSGSSDLHVFGSFKTLCHLHGLGLLIRIRMVLHACFLDEEDFLRTKCFCNCLQGLHRVKGLRFSIQGSKLLKGGYIGEYTGEHYRTSLRGILGV